MKFAHNGELTAYNDVCTTYNGELTAYKEVCIAYNGELTAYNEVCTAYNGKLTAYNEVCTAYINDGHHVIKDYNLRQLQHSILLSELLNGYSDLHTQRPHDYRIQKQKNFLPCANDIENI